MPPPADTSAALEVSRLDGADPACEAFVRSRPEANLCHLPAYGEYVRRAGRHEPVYLVARRGAEVRGVLPLAHVRSLIFGNRMVSHAYRNYGGPLAADDQAALALFDRAVEEATERGCETIEFRNERPLAMALTPRTDKVCMVRPLDPDPEVVWKGLEFRMRNHVRKAEKSGVVAVDGGLELLDEFYSAYTHRMRELGTPCYARSVMGAMLEVMPEHTRLFVVRMGSEPAGGGITTLFNGRAEIPYAATLTRFGKFAANNLLYWAVLRHYCRAGARLFDFGRCTPGEGTYQFKKQWGTTPVELHYQYWVRPGHRLSIASPDNPRYRRLVEIWKRLPLPLTRALGPAISRGLP